MLLLRPRRIIGRSCSRWFGLCPTGVGRLADPWRCALAAICVGGAAVSPAYPLVLLLVFAGGPRHRGPFHPEAPVTATRPETCKRDGLFQQRRKAGYGLGIRAGQLVVWLGLVGGLVAMVARCGCLVRAGPSRAALSGLSRRLTKTAYQRGRRSAGGRWRFSGGDRVNAAFRDSVLLAFVPRYLDRLRSALESGWKPTLS